MSTTVRHLVEEHPVNFVKETRYMSASSKDWANKYHPISNLIVRTSVDNNGITWADFGGSFLPTLRDDEVRLSLPANRPNRRIWRMDMEADAAAWFHTEVSNVVLAGWIEQPTVLQASEMKALDENNVKEIVDTTYSIGIKRHERVPMVIGEFKRGLIDRWGWQGGRLSAVQQNLSRELRGYAYKYSCLQMFCFDGMTLLILQFRAVKIDHMRDAKLAVDCWVIPRENEGGTTLRYALYRLLAQGFRRCQGLSAELAEVGGVLPDRREFFSGVPLWLAKDKKLERRHPYGYYRDVYIGSGRLYWAYEDKAITDQQGSWVWDSVGFWEQQVYVDETTDEPADVPTDEPTGEPTDEPTDDEIYD
ncbi:hypothetical protein B0T17DRAFT_593855 [Bombardia bombarda]|uniref:Uncharacterized protein n=1 Tax=Bombardia bombarda TaxID=252184 RepID=A0AA39U1T8_9PEZI|nr:hypothetical protein B0T17DRAFT_593855 [Bombardia bombarda]